jgi:hypothetical protein
MMLLLLGWLIGLSAVVPASGQPITTAVEAISRANALTRLETVSGTPAAALVKVREDVTPFLGERNVGKRAWRVNYPKSSLKFASAAGGLKDRFRRTCVVMLEAASGRLFFVTSTYAGPPDPDMRPMPSSGLATAQLSNEGEVYDGYPDEDPRVDFLAALERILGHGMGSPFLAKEIHGAYVLHSRMGAKPRPVWAITLRGLPPFAAHGPDPKSVPVWQRNHMRNVVDAVTGQVLFATNQPQ